MVDVDRVRRESLVRYLSRNTSSEVRFDDTSRNLYSTDASHYRVQPLGVVIPKTAEDLLATVQITAEVGVPIIARGGGTSLTGQSIGRGIIIDCSKYLNQMLDLDVASRMARVQPGLVLEHLNTQLAPHDLIFGPDVATINRATLGGMIGNNSAGARSVVYGQTVDHLQSLTGILADGSRVRFGPISERDYERKNESRSLEGNAYRLIDDLIPRHAEEIDRRFPKIIRKVSGYNLPALLDPQAKVRRNLLPLLVGSEGTLAVTQEVELKLVSRPKFRGLLVPQFDSLRACLDTLPICLEFQPSAVELLDKLYIDLAREQRSLRDAMAAISGRPAALLMVEFSSDHASDITSRIERLTRKLRGAIGLTAVVPATEPKLRDPLWNLRSAAVPLLYSIKGAGKPITFCEDTAVSPEKLPEFAERFREIFHKHGTVGTFYGHASVGCLHIRPVLNLHDPSDVKRMRAIMQDVTDLVLEFGGSLSGEHGDGLVRSEWNGKMFGPKLYEVFRQIKRVFDPGNILNPGKIVDAQAMEENFRIAPGAVIPPAETLFDYTRQGNFFSSIEICNGAGVCRKTQGGTMCPSYRATRDERDSTRGRANALRIALETTPSASKRSPLEDRWLAEVMDLCLSCKACKNECPSNVDMAKLKAEFLQAHYAHRHRPLGDHLVKNVHLLSPWASRFSRIANRFGQSRLLRRLTEAFVGIDRRRSLPHWHREHFRRWFQQRPQSSETATPRVILLDDCFTTFQEPHIGQAAVELLERAGFQVELAGICCGRAMISKGFLKSAKQLAALGVQRLGEAARQGVPILGLEPSCLLTLADEWPELLPGAEAEKIAAQTRLVEGWLAEQIAKGIGAKPFAVPERRVMLHTHCHQKALLGSNDSISALQSIPGLEVQMLDAGCCGMAGSFGYEKTHYDLSVKIANISLIPALDAEPEMLIAATGTSCRHQIRDLTGRVAFHPVEMLARTTRPQESLHFFRPRSRA